MKNDNYTDLETLVIQIVVLSIYSKIFAKITEASDRSKLHIYL